MKHLIWSLVLAGALVAGGAPEASAHGSLYGGHFAYDRYYVVRHGHHFPRWLHRHPDFHRWYWRSHFRNDYYRSWNELFDIYCYERKFRRTFRDAHHHARGHGPRRYH